MKLHGLRAAPCFSAVQAKTSRVHADLANSAPAPEYGLNAVRPRRWPHWQPTRGPSPEPSTQAAAHAVEDGRIAAGTESQPSSAPAGPAMQSQESQSGRAAGGNVLHSQRPEEQQRGNQPLHKSLFRGALRRLAGKQSPGSAGGAGKHRITSPMRDAMYMVGCIHCAGSEPGNGS